jgi:hypothetical protein
MPLMPAPPMPTKWTRPEVGVTQAQSSGPPTRTGARTADRTRSASASSASREPDAAAAALMAAAARGR